jgi:GNAT superfamily N-acetyltransferase
MKQLWYPYSTSMYVTDLELSRRLERAEGRAATRFVEARARFDLTVGASWTEVAGAYLLYDGPESPATQTFGLGLFGLPSKEEMEKIEEFFDSRGAPVLHEVSPLADAGMLGLLGERGYRPVELTSILVQPLAARRFATTEVAVREARSNEGDLWATTAAGGWRGSVEINDSLMGLMRMMGDTEDLRIYFAEIEGQPVATGALAVHAGAALLAGASTLPEWRNRGAQRALLEHRLACARANGCELAIMGAAPGSASQRNAERHGFRIAYTRIKWGRR